MITCNNITLINDNIISHNIGIWYTLYIVVYKPSMFTPDFIIVMHLFEF